MWIIELNLVSCKDSYPLWLIQDIFDQLEGAQMFLTLDFKNGYWQVPMAERNISKTVFLCHRGLFDFLRMPFGLTNAPTIFQKTLETVLHRLNGSICYSYL